MFVVVGETTSKTWGVNTRETGFGNSKLQFPWTGVLAS